MLMFGEEDVGDGFELWLEQRRLVVGPVIKRFFLLSLVSLHNLTTREVILPLLSHHPLSNGLILTGLLL